MPPCVDLPTGNVHVLPVQRRTEDTPESPSAPGPSPASTVEWVIRDAEGAVVETLAGTRSAALRRMGAAAFRGASLPVVLWGPDGQPTGDRLPG